MVTPLHSVTDPNPTAVLYCSIAARGVQYCCKPHTEDSHPGGSSEENGGGKFAEGLVKVCSDRFTTRTCLTLCMRVLFKSIISLFFAE